MSQSPYWFAPMKRFASLCAALSLSSFVLAVFNASPSSAQSSTDYTLNPGDALQVSVWREAELTRQLVILPDGTIGFPLVGRLEVAGKTTTQAEEALEAELIKTIRSPRVTIVVTSVEGNRAYVIGKINAPGAYTMQAPMTVAQLITLAGGFTEFAKENKIIVERTKNGAVERRRVDLSGLLRGNVDDEDATDYLQAGDLVIVP